MGKKQSTPIEQQHKQPRPVKQTGKPTNANTEPQTRGNGRKGGDNKAQS